MTAVTFDCWNTLLCEEDWHDAHRLRVEALRSAAEEAGRPVEAEAATQAFDRAWSRHMQLWEEGEATGARHVAAWALDELGAPPAPGALQHLVRHFEEASHSSRVLGLPGARETLEALDRAGVPMALVCDTGLTPGRVVRQHLERLGLLSPLRAQVFSDEVGVPKPAAEMFRCALDALGVGPQGAIHVGDLRRTDVAGARDFGMVTVRLAARHDDGSAWPEADHVAASHSELLELLERLRAGGA